MTTVEIARKMLSAPPKPHDETKIKNSEPKGAEKSVPKTARKAVQEQRSPAGPGFAFSLGLAEGGSRTQLLLAKPALRAGLEAKAELVWPRAPMSTYVLKATRPRPCVRIDVHTLRPRCGMNHIESP
jgi:hypothetical protein